MMSLEEISQKIQASAKRLLAEGRAEVVIGYRRGTTPLTVAPHFARTAEDCDQLVWSSFAKINLATYLPKYPGKVALVAKGCDARSAVGQVVENQVLRENLYIIGVACNGMVDVERILAGEPRPAFEATEDQATIKLSGEGWITSLAREEVLRRNCRVCVSRTPSATADEVIGDQTEPLSADDFADLKELAGRSPADKLAYFKGLVKECLRCYACRNACPLCYCPVCFVDETRPQWLGKSQDEMDTFTFHVLRAFHCAGRCTSCGACETACPMDIKLREFNRVLESEVQKDWQYTPGLTWDQKPPLTTYRPDDEAEFIK
ncbi:MAG: 4Fe-4S dicluster domain-containing protein [Candidatus Adiutrix sp.]|jgi:ferredoxin|nr:4Fe-4S dicluster domain-containing protein [Candidatus Adiutrix sp.]